MSERDGVSQGDGVLELDGAGRAEAATPRPLAGLRVVELSQFIAGPHCGQLLADFGAEVTKVEPPGGDPARAFPGTGHGSLFYRCYNTGKDSVVLDLRTAQGHDRLEELIDQADAVVVNMGPGTIERLGLSWPGLHERHPHVVLTVISAYGAGDPRICFDTIAQVESGYAVSNADEHGRPRVTSGYPVDVLCGLHAALATAMALLDPARREPEGTRGVLVDVPMVETALAALAGPPAIAAAETGASPVSRGNRDVTTAPSGLYPCADGHVYIYAGIDKHYQRLRPLVGTPDLNAADRLAAADELDAAVRRWTAARGAAEIADTLRALGVPAGVARTPAAALAALPADLLVRADDGQAVPAFPVRFGGSRVPRRPAPALPAPSEGNTS